MTLRLLSVSFDRVEFYAQTDDESRYVTVQVRGSGRDWYRLLSFPNYTTDGGRSLGSDALDEQVRIRASEELVRPDAATALAAGRWAA